MKYLIPLGLLLSTLATVNSLHLGLGRIPTVIIGQIVNKLLNTFGAASSSDQPIVGKVITAVNPIFSKLYLAKFGGNGGGGGMGEMTSGGTVDPFELEVVEEEEEVGYAHTPSSAVDGGISSKAQFSEEIQQKKHLTPSLSHTTPEYPATDYIYPPAVAINDITSDQIGYEYRGVK